MAVTSAQRKYYKMLGLQQVWPYYQLQSSESRDSVSVSLQVYRIGSPRFQLWVLISVKGDVIYVTVGCVAYLMCFHSPKFH